MKKDLNDILLCRHGVDKDLCIGCTEGIPIHIPATKTQAAPTTSVAAVDQDELELMIQDCMNRHSKMSDWDAEFIESVNAQITNGRTLSDKQAKVIEKIWNRVT